MQYRKAYPPGDELVAAILEKVTSKETEWWIRRNACQAIAIQVLGHPRPPLLKNAIPQPDAAIEPHLKLILPVLTQLLTDEDVRMSHAAATALLKISVRRPKLVATVLDYLDSELSNPRAAPAASMSSQNYGHLLLSELQQFVTQPGAREALLPAMPHLKSLRDKHPAASGMLSSIMMQLDPAQGRSVRGRAHTGAVGREMISDF